MKTRIIRIGNSQGVRIPKPLLEQAGLAGELELTVEDSRIVITRASGPRPGWAAAFIAVHAASADELLDEPTPTRFDEEEWEWPE